MKKEEEGKAWQHRDSNSQPFVQTLEQRPLLFDFTALKMASEIVRCEPNYHFSLPL